MDNDILEKTPRFILLPSGHVGRLVDYNDTVRYVYSVEEALEVLSEWLEDLKITIDDYDYLIEVCKKSLLPDTYEEVDPEIQRTLMIGQLEELHDRIDGVEDDIGSTGARDIRVIQADERMLDQEAQQHAKHDVLDDIFPDHAPLDTKYKH